MRVVYLDGEFKQDILIAEIRLLEASVADTLAPTQ